MGGGGGGWKNLRQLCKPEMQSLVCRTFENSPSPRVFSLYIRYFYAVIISTFFSWQNKKIGLQCVHVRLTSRGVIKKIKECQRKNSKEIRYGLSI